MDTLSFSSQQADIASRKPSQTYTLTLADTVDTKSTLGLSFKSRI